MALSVKWRKQVEGGEGDGGGRERGGGKEVARVGGGALASAFIEGKKGGVAWWRIKRRRGRGDSDVLMRLKKEGDGSERFLGHGPFSGADGPGEKKETERNKRASACFQFFSSFVFFFLRNKRAKREGKNKLEARFYFSTKYFCNINFSNIF